MTLMPTTRAKKPAARTASRRTPANKLNELEPRDWLKFQKSWFIHNPPPRPRGVLAHPAKFPETLVREFIEFFTKPGGWVFDPMLGTGSTLVACIQSGRNGVGIELNPRYAGIARGEVEAARESAGRNAARLRSDIIEGDASRAAQLFGARELPPIDYMITSPPSWDMLRARGAATQRARRAAPELDVYYSEDARDLGNESDYEQFLARLTRLYAGLRPIFRPGAYLTIIAKNVKKGGTIYPLAWDLARGLRSTYTLKDERIWCQDNVKLAPYGLGSAWVSNTVHHYCLQMRCE
jgi:DNA modification methylase